MDKDLKDYVAKRVSAGANPAEVKAELVAKGWKAEHVDRALGEVVSVQKGDKVSGVPAPASMVEIFFGGAAISLLWTVAFALGALYFQIINKFFPDALVNSRGSYWYFWSSPTSDHLIRFSIATLLVAFPLYIALVIFLFKRFDSSPDKKESRLIKWFTYIVLYSAASTAMWDIIGMIRNFLEGELGTRTFLRALTVLVISALAIVFYFYERKKIEFRQTFKPLIFWIVGGVTLVLVIAGMIMGLVYAKSPGTERNRKFDDSRATNLKQLQIGIEAYTTKHKTLPTSLEALKSDTNYSYYYQYALDPENKKPFDYTVVAQPGSNGTAKYRLCANFTLTAEPDRDQLDYGYGYFGYNAEWGDHDKGRVCKDKDVKVFTPVSTTTVDYYR